MKVNKSMTTEDFDIYHGRISQTLFLMMHDSYKEGYSIGGTLPEISKLSGKSVVELVTNRINKTGS